MRHVEQSTTNHVPVLLKEVLEMLNPKPREIVLDATVGGGGHARALLTRVGEAGTVIGMDQDTKALALLKKELRRDNFIAVSGNFRHAGALLRRAGIRSLHAALFDLGMSSWQLEHSGRGFSFLRDEPLVMSFDPHPSPHRTAAAILNQYDEQSLATLLFEYGEERHARRIARAIAQERRQKPFRTTFDLVRLLEHVLPFRRRRIHPATKTFQALRIAVNDELSALQDGLNEVWKYLDDGGRLAVIAFHSLEDRIVKRFFQLKKQSRSGEIITKRPLTASAEELRNNPRARSAKLRVIIKIRTAD